MGVLSGDEIQRRLLEGEAEGGVIFKRGTWESRRLRGAAYDLCIATDLLILPDGTRYWPDGPVDYQWRAAPFVLRPKEVAFVSSAEDLCMPLDLAGNIAPRFRRALQGLLVMGGMLVDPGYHGRLHFQLANIGDKPIEVMPGETSVAALQLMPVEGTQGAAESRVPDSNGLLASLFHAQAKDPLPPLAFFSDVGVLRKDVDDLADQVDDQKITLDSTKRSTDQVIVFGVFLLSITLFTVAIAALIEAIASGSALEAAGAIAEADTAGGLNHDGLIAVIVLVVLVAVFCAAMIGSALYMLKPRKGARQSGS